MATLNARSIIDSHVRLWDGSNQPIGLPSSINETPIEGIIAVETNDGRDDVVTGPPVLGVIVKPSYEPENTPHSRIVGVQVGVPDGRLSEITTPDRVVDIDVTGDQLGVVADSLDTEPTIRRYVLDHLGRPEVGNTRSFIDWCVDIDRIASHPNVACKLSGLITETMERPIDLAVIGGYVDKVIDAFGIGRVMFASNWPLPTTTAYRAWVDAVAEIIGSDQGLQDAVFADNARRFYRLGPDEQSPDSATTSMCLG